MKFGNDRIAEWLYCIDCGDEQTGDSSERGGYAIYRAPFEPSEEMIKDFELTADDLETLKTTAGVILSEDNNGFVEADYYESERSLEEMWERALDWTADQAEDEPDEDGGDYTTNDHVRFFQYGKRVITVAEGDDWRKAVKAHMDAEEFWPNVWLISDHGNTCLLSLEE